MPLESSWKKVKTPTSRACNNIENVRSKYFVGNSGMDESFSDFQESKPKCAGPKPVQKPVKRRQTKRIKGQKDIRTALKGKKNELVAYTKEFDTVCKKSGLDVDSEQLQLAIALSKSLQTESETAIDCSEPLPTQARVAKIRKTLQEYGFKVPEPKVTNRKTRKLRKHYKLLTITEEERHQTISGKYSEVLLNNLDSNTLLGHNSSNNQDINFNLYDIATKVPYEYIKDSTVFYVDNLVQKSRTTGSLLRDWSKIPGRPVSPKLVETEMMNTVIDCSQDELDVVLSGPITLARDIMATNNKVAPISVIPKVIIDEEDIVNCEEADCKSEGFDSRNLVKVTEIQSPVKELEIIDVHNSSTQYRSRSPDLFDDELSSVMETSKPIIIGSQEHKTKVFADNFMDLTECANPVSQKSVNFTLSQNKTKRKSNDLMEMTECVVALSQPILEASQEIDLTQSPENKTIENHDVSESKENTSSLNHVEQNSCSLEENVTCIANEVQNDKLDTEDIDLTQSSNEEGYVEKKSKDITTESMDLTQSSNSNGIDDLPFVSIGNTQSEVSLDETIIVNEEEYISAIIKPKKSIILGAANSEILDVTEDAKCCRESDQSLVKETNEKSKSSSFEEFEHDHSRDSDIMDHGSNLLDDESAHNTSKESNDIDLTQSSGETEESLKSFPNNSSLGKKDDVSIDYDEIENNSIRKSANHSKQKIIDASESVIDEIEILDDNNEPEINSSQNSEVFNISDKELDYSLHQSRFETRNDNFDFGGISILDNITKIGSFRQSTNVARISNIPKNSTLSESFLPELKIKKSIIKDASPGSNRQFPEIPNNVAQDILNSNGEEISIRTPKNSEYIIKTSNVTPMADYASMSTPQMNKELDKYGLKPFKRKRAIKILTHLYNQTHPTIQQLVEEDEPSPKKPRTETNTHHLSPRKLSISPQCSPRKEGSSQLTDQVLSLNKLASPSKSPAKTSKATKKTDVNNCVTVETHVDVNVCYEVTSEVAVIKGVECDPEDWVFQKREKAKVHSCRVPLHIAFHNYVSSRRDLREAILKYEPVNIDVIHKDLVGYGHRYDPKDLLKYLDKKCITVKTTDNNSRNNKR
ncbi:structure-specific endonuclease subunit SLX4 [Trichoplusia ni]|uniref:Structure-specific endonuclease subunit SLX4 n=1 Tax=Trichoplusia ni TaxID=7111 RepID=A0A7E5W449_TRINI|nr:structure-specific endonuclease subunit SLX4 [Trichoplusia ni]